MLVCTLTHRIFAQCAYTVYVCVLLHVICCERYVLQRSHNNGRSGVGSMGSWNPSFENHPLPVARSATTPCARMSLAVVGYTLHKMVYSMTSYCRDGLGRGLHPATRTFQALRIVVNNEVSSSLLVMNPHYTKPCLGLQVIQYCSPSSLCSLKSWSMVSWQHLIY